MELIVIAALVAAFEFAALRWGYDSRDDFAAFTRDNIATFKRANFDLPRTHRR